MAGMIITYYRNYDSSDTTTTGERYTSNDPLPTIEACGWEPPSGYQLKEWNTSRDGTGLAFQPGVTISSGSPAYESTKYAIWEHEVISYITTDTELISVANAIRTKGGTSASLEWPNGYVSAVGAISAGGGGSSSMSDPIRFFDYDGTLVASYTSVPSSLPSVPTHTGLTGGVWNYSLAQITTQFNAMGTCDVGANYATSSGATEIDIVLDDQNCLSPYLGICPNGTATINWGDNSTSTVTGTSYDTVKHIQHVYSSTGSYTIKISGPFAFKSGSSSASALLLEANVSNSRSTTYSNAIRHVRIGTNAVLGNYGLHYLGLLEDVSIPSGTTSFGTAFFQRCLSLNFIAIPSETTSLPGQAFYYCTGMIAISIPSSVTSVGYSTFGYHVKAQRFYSLPSGLTGLSSSMFTYNYNIRDVKIPSGVTSIGKTAFSYCECVTEIEIPSGVTSIDESVFSSCHSLSSLDIPASVESIGNRAFNDCYGIREYHFRRTASVPTLGTTAFSNISSNCKIYVPSSKLNDYKTAENWASYAKYMVGE